MEIKKIHSLFLQSAGITTDSRVIKKNQMFFALKGDNFDGNRYANKAIDEGASYSVVDDSNIADKENIIKVGNVLACLQELAAYHRDFLNIPIIAITGTNGKTTTKELVSAVLTQKYNLAFTQGNFNNHIGVPLTILSFTKETQLAVVEMGANHPGEIRSLCQIAKPNYGIITNIGKAHLEGFGSLEGVIRTKSELYNYLKNNIDSKIFINADDELLLSISSGLSRVSYGKDCAADIVVDFIESNPFLEMKWNNNIISTNLVGDYNFDNVALAICVGNYFKVSDEQIISAISNYEPQNKRSQLLQTNKNNTLIVDAYNANPESMRLSVTNFSKLKSADKILMLGDMLELGSASEIEHQGILEMILSLKFNKVFLIGKQFGALKNNYPQYKFVDTAKELCAYIDKNKFENKSILLKASRGIKLEHVIDFL